MKTILDINIISGEQCLADFRFNQCEISALVSLAESNGLEIDINMKQ